MTDIIATVGPASESPELLRALGDLGVRYFRLNFSHGSHAEHGTRIARIRAAVPEAQIILDTKGPDIRTGDLPSAECLHLAAGDFLRLTIIPSEQNASERVLYVDYDGLIDGAAVGDEIMLDSGQIVLRVEELTATSLVTRALTGGTIGSRRHVNLPGRDISLPTITEREERDLAFGASLGVEIVALSFARSAADIAAARALVPGAAIWAKIENIAGLTNFDEIVAEADGIMIARGDLGTETPWVDVPTRQVELVQRTKAAGKYAIVATEMFESMIEHTRPTRAEVTDVAFAVWQGADAVMLSAETAAGRHPILCVEKMREIITAAERSGLHVSFK